MANGKFWFGIQQASNTKRTTRTFRSPRVIVSLAFTRPLYVGKERQPEYTVYNIPTTLQYYVKRSHIEFTVLHFRHFTCYFDL